MSENEVNDIGNYIDSLRDKNSILSGDFELLPENLLKLYERWESLEEKACVELRSSLVHPDDAAELRQMVIEAKYEFKESLSQSIDNYHIMAKRKTSDASSDLTQKEGRAARAGNEITNANENKETQEEIKKVKREPQMVTVNGDKVSHAHVYKSNTSEDWYFTAKINDVPLKPQRVSKEDMEAVINKTKDIETLMNTYYPTKLMPKLSPEAFKIPTSIDMPNGGKEMIQKFNVYKESNPENAHVGRYHFYAKVGDHHMSALASKKDLDAYFDRVETPQKIISRVFGDRLHLADHYQQFKLPESMDIAEKDIRLMKNQHTNRYEIHVNLGDGLRTPSKEISYDDRQSYFATKTATKEQLAAKYLGKELQDINANMIKKSMEKERTPSLAL